MTPLNQRDPRWSRIALGTSNTTIGSHGCTITCIAMLAGTTPDVVNKRFKALPKDKNGNTGFANGNLVVWTRIREAFPDLEFRWRSYTYNNDVIKTNVPTMVEVDFDGSPRSNDSHWVVFIGNKQLLDPWYGKQRPTSSYPILKGYALVKKKIDNVGIDSAIVNLPDEEAPATSEEITATIETEPNNVPQSPPDANLQPTSTDVPGDNTSINQEQSNGSTIDSSVVGDTVDYSLPQNLSETSENNQKTTSFLDRLINWFLSLFIRKEAN